MPNSVCFAGNHIQSVHSMGAPWIWDWNMTVPGGRGQGGLFCHCLPLCYVVSLSLLSHDTHVHKHRHTYALPTRASLGPHSVNPEASSELPPSTPFPPQDSALCSIPPQRGWSRSRRPCISCLRLHGPTTFPCHNYEDIETESGVEWCTQEPSSSDDQTKIWLR